MHYSKFATLTLAAALAACGGGGSKSNTQSTPSASVTVVLDGLMTQGSNLVLPTYVSHLYGGSVGLDLAKITIQNTGPSPTTYIATVDIPGHDSAAGTKTVTIGAGASQAFNLTPALSLPSLFALTTAVPAQVNVKVMAGATQVYQNTTNIQVSGRNTVFWSEDGQSLVPLAAAMVTPNDKGLQISSLAHDAALLFPGGSLLGYQTGAAWPSTSSGPLAAGTAMQEQFRVLAGDSISVTIDGVTDGLGASTAAVFILDDTNFTSWVAGGTATSCAGSNTVSAGTTVTCATPAEGLWHIVYLNTDAARTQTITRHRPMGRWETTYEQARAVFDALRARGLIYANLPGTGFFSSSQSVMFPVESLLTKNANCIEGSLVFASIWERMGMEPILAMSFAHGHAIAGVRCWAGSANCVIPVETTAVGGTLTFDEAVSSGATTWTTWTGDGSGQFVDVRAMRAVGLTPAPM